MNAIESTKVQDNTATKQETAQPFNAAELLKESIKHFEAHKSQADDKHLPKLEIEHGDPEKVNQISKEDGQAIKAVLEHDKWNKTSNPDKDPHSKIGMVSKVIHGVKTTVGEHPLTTHPAVPHPVAPHPAIPHK